MTLRILSGKGCKTAVIAIKTLKLFSLRVHIHFLSVFSFFALCISNNPVFSLLVLLCALLHEASHIIAIVLCGGKITDFYFHPFGAEIKYSSSLSYKKDFIIALCGPLANLLTFAGSLPFLNINTNTYFMFFAFCSLFLALLNLLPLRSFDGGRMLGILYMSILPYEKALKLSKISELISLILLCVFCIFTIIFCGYNLSLIFICAYIFVSCYRGSFP